MMIKSNSSDAAQSHLFKSLLCDIVSIRHAMMKLADTIACQSFEDGLQECFCADNGRPSCPVRLMVSLHYLKYSHGMSDKAELSRVIRGIDRKALSPDVELQKLLELGKRLFAQKRTDNQSKPVKSLIGLEKEERKKERTFPQKVFSSRIRLLRNRLTIFRAMKDIDWGRQIHGFMIVNICLVWLSFLEDSLICKRHK